MQDIATRLECHRNTVRRTCRQYEQHGLAGLFGPIQRSGRPREIFPLQRAQIVELASLEPIAEGLHITHWSSEDLAREAVRQKIVPQISARTVR